VASKKESNPSRQAILEAAVSLLETRGPDGFTIDDVLIESETSSSSLYHHFGSRDLLLAAAQHESYRRTTRAEDRRNLDGGFAATAIEDLWEYVAGQIRRIVTDPDVRTVRRGRLATAGRAMASPELAAKVRSTQEKMVDAIAEMFTNAQARGILDPALDTRAYAAWFHGMTLSRTITEGGSVATESWLAIAIPAALAPLRPPPNPAASG